MFTVLQRGAFSLLLGATVLCSAPKSQGQISVGLFGSPANPFTNPPPASEWATRDTFVGDSTTYNTPASLDIGAQTFDQSTITNALLATTVDGNARLARHNTAQSYLVTRPEGPPAMVLKATLRNTSAAGISSITVSYDFTVSIVGPHETAPGHRVFFSLTGQSNTWQLIPSFSGLTNATNVRATLSFEVWPNNTDLYLLWLDDNAVTNPEGAHTIDNFAVSEVQLAIPRPTIVRNAATGEITIAWSSGTLVETTQLLNGGTVWTDVPGNPTSPYTFTPAPGTQLFFAVRL